MRLAVRPQGGWMARFAAAACGAAALAGLTLPFSSVMIGFFCIEDLW